MSKAAIKTKSEPTFLGHPIGLLWLAASEFWERFCYYGMQMLLVLYLTHYLLQPGHIEQVWGFGFFKRLIEGLYATPTTMAIASNTAQLYAALVYLTPILGGLLADRVLGRTKTVTLGALLMVGGTFLLALNQTFLLGLAVLLGGVGCFKANIASQVGALYATDDPRRADGFQIYFIGIQLAVILAPIICGTLAQKVDWHLGFIAAGIGMTVALATYLTGRKTFPPEQIQKKGDHTVRPPLTRRDWQVVILLVALLPVLALAGVANLQIFDAYLVWAEKNYQLAFFGGTMPVTWMGSMDAAISSVLMIGIVAFWRWYGRIRKEPSEISKVIIGVLISVLGPLVLAAASAVVAKTGQPVSLAWAVAFHVLNDLGFANVLPVGLALYSRCAPKGLGGMMIATFYLHLFFGNLLVGYIGGLLGSIADTSFWLMHAGLMVVAAVLLVLARAAFGKLLMPVAVPEATAQTRL